MNPIWVTVQHPDVFKKGGIMSQIDSQLSAYIEKRTGSPVESQLETLEPLINTQPVLVLRSIRSLLEASFEYVYRYVSGGNTLPGPNWCLFCRAKDYKAFKKTCDQISERRNAEVPSDYRQMWDAVQLVRKHVERAWKKVEKDTKGFIPPIIATLT